MIEKDQYKKIVELMPILVIDYLIYENENSSNVLLVKRKNKPLKGEWWVPGGRIFKEESVEKAAKRILRQETKILKSDLKYLSFVGYYDAHYEESEWETPTHTISLIFEGILKSRETPIILDNQSSAYKFDKIPENLIEFIYN